MRNEQLEHKLRLTFGSLVYMEKVDLYKVQVGQDKLQFEIIYNTEGQMLADTIGYKSCALRSALGVSYLAFKTVDGIRKLIIDNSVVEIKDPLPNINGNYDLVPSKLLVLKLHISNIFTLHRLDGTQIAPAFKSAVNIETPSLLYGNNSVQRMFGYSTKAHSSILNPLNSNIRMFHGDKTETIIFGSGEAMTFDSVRVNEYRPIYIVKKNSLYGVIDSDGRVLADCIFDAIQESSRPNKLELIKNHRKSTMKLDVYANI